MRLVVAIAVLCGVWESRPAIPVAMNVVDDNHVPVRHAQRFEHPLPEIVLILIHTTVEVLPSTSIKSLERLSP